MKRVIQILLILALAAITQFSVPGPSHAAKNGAQASEAAGQNGTIAKVICRIAIGSIGGPYFAGFAASCVWFTVLEFLA
jgi:hypothetical protein